MTAPPSSPTLKPAFPSSMHPRTPPFAGPTHRGLKIVTAQDALRVIECCRQGHPDFPKVTRRLTRDWHRRKELLAPGTVFVFEAHPTLDRWTDGLHWGPNKQERDFLRYVEAMGSETVRPRPQSSSGQSETVGLHPSAKKTAKGLPYRRPHTIEKPDPLIKRTYTILVAGDSSQSNTKSKWELIYYSKPSFTTTSGPRLISVMEHPVLKNVVIPLHLFSSAKSTKGSPDPKPDPKLLIGRFESTSSPSEANRYSSSSSNWTDMDCTGSTLSPSPEILCSCVDLPDKLPPLRDPDPTRCALPSLSDILTNCNGTGSCKPSGWW